MFGDMQQLPPIPASAALFNPPLGKKTGSAKEVLDIFWGDGADALNFWKELTIQVRVQDQWFDALLKECRAGNLTEEMYNFLMGLPTEHAGSWLPRKDGTGIAQCGLSECNNLPARWRHMALKGGS